VTAEVTREGTSQKINSRTTAMPRYKSTEQNSPSLAVRKERKRRPTVMPPQKPVAEAPEAKALAWRILVMKTTIQPPRETVGLWDWGMGGWKGGDTFSAHVAEDEEGKEPGYFVL
jgi:hypothetical protein